uniref:Uncharacterized protein n=1 Tax=Clavibacter phage CN77 TaxID=686440 RepID=E9LS37_9VIRU|nr:unknown [Clavibacter phage CN77]
MDWFAGSPSVKARFYNDSTGAYIGSLEGGSTTTSGAVGVYSYGLASFDDITLQTIVTPALGVRLAFTPDGTTRVTGRLTYFDGAKKHPDPLCPCDPVRQEAGSAVREAVRHGASRRVSGLRRDEYARLHGVRGARCYGLGVLGCAFLGWRVLRPPRRRPEPHESEPR